MTQPALDPGRAAAPVLEARGVEKWYGPLPAVRGVGFALGEGEFLTLFGPNGAGKTTLLKMLAGLVRPTRGEVRIAGEAVTGGDGAWRGSIGVLSHQTFLYAGLSAAENLEFYGRLYGLDRLRERVGEALEGVGLWERRGDRVRGFSRGMQQRLALARTLLHDPRLVLLDEPYTGLDPHAAAMLGGVLERLRDGARTVVLVTHNLSQGLELASRVAIQVGGRWISDEPRAGIDPVLWERVYTARVAGAA
ncbi:MAG TPA: heme ABC exporter ATP-binding protein CcmA [Longimicrobiaceae bacterium]|nr:heme ABC exporter ATP-binding protein CcmA [Longimicrobiaceae bacterium]